MCAGYELCAPQPSPAHLDDVSDYPAVIEVLDLIFQHPEKRFPSVEELLSNDFFRHIDLREMRATPLPVSDTNQHTSQNKHKDCLSLKGSSKL